MTIQPNTLVQHPKQHKQQPQRQQTQQTNQVEQPHVIPTSIQTALSKQQDRIYLLHLEQELIKFIESVSKDLTASYAIPASYLKNSYYRLLSHQLCQYYKLSHWNNKATNEITVTMVEGVDYTFINTSIFVMLNKAVAEVEEQQQQQQQQEQADATVSPIQPLMKPKLIVKKKKEVSVPTSATSENSETSRDNSFIQDTASSTPTSINESVNNIESERASKEALYMKLRQEIFQNEDDQEEEEEEQEEDEDRDIDNQAFARSPFNNNNIYGQQIPMQMYPNGYYPTPIVFPGYSAYPQYPQYVTPMPTTSNIPATPPYPNFTMYNPSLVQSSAPLPYDKETERRLLNNPYIIIPDNNHRQKGGHKRYYKKNNTNGYSKGTSGQTNARSSTNKY